MIALVYLIGLVSLVCWILVLIKVFQSGNTLMGVLSICPLVCFIYGWVKVNELKARQIMLIWTGCVVLNLILQFTLAPGTAVVPATR